MTRDRNTTRALEDVKVNVKLKLAALWASFRHCQVKFGETDQRQANNSGRHISEPRAVRSAVLGCHGEPCNFVPNGKTLLTRLAIRLRC